MFYPLSKFTRLEVQAAAHQMNEIFTDREGYEVVETNRYMAYPLSAFLVRDTSRWRRLLSVGGSRARIGVTQAVEVTPGSLRYTEYAGEIQFYAGIFEGAAVASRLFGTGLRVATREPIISAVGTFSGPIRSQATGDVASC